MTFELPATSTGDVLQVAGNPTALTVDQNTPAVFQLEVQASVAGTYTLTATAPDDWSVAIGDTGQATVTPKPGTQSGDYQVRFVVRSELNPERAATAVVTVTVTPTLPGLDFDVEADPVFTVPFAGAQVPTSFLARLRNLGPNPDTFNLTFPNPPAGFNLLRSLESVTVPAGETGIVGVYLEPSGQLPAPGTPVSFTVTATSSSDPALTATETVTFAMPTVLAYTTATDLPQLSSIPGAPATATLTFTNVGNVPAQIATATALPAGLSLSGLNPQVVLAVGQSTTQQVTLTPSAQTPLNSTLTATLITGPAVAQDMVSVVDVSTDRPLVEPGQRVNVSARVHAGIVQERPAGASFVVRSPQGNVVFQSAAVPLVLPVSTSVQVVDLGELDTAGFAPGAYSIEATIDGAVGQGTLVVGLPLAARQALEPAVLTEGLELTYVTGEATVTSRLSVGTQPLVSLLDTPGTARTVALSGTLAYVAGTADVSIIDLADPARPVLVKSLGAGVLSSFGTNIAAVAGDKLIVATQDALNASASKLAVFSLADPRDPQLLGSVTIPYRLLGDLAIQGTTVLASVSAVSFALPGKILAQFGDLVAVDFSDPANPVLAGVLFDNLGPPNGGSRNVHSITSLSPQLAYAGSTTSTGAAAGTGEGRLLVVDTSTPGALSLLRSVAIPGTVHVLDVAVDGDRALVVGSSRGHRDPFNGFADLGLDGQLTLTLLDLADPRHPAVLGTTEVTSAAFAKGSLVGKVEAVALGARRFAVSGVTDGESVIVVVDASSPAQLHADQLIAPGVTNGLAVAGGLLHAVSEAGLASYRVDAITRLPVRVAVQVPSGGPGGVVPGSFNLPPTTIEPGAGFDTLVWELTLTAARPSQELSWLSALSGVAAGTTAQVTLGAEVRYSPAAGPSTFDLPPLAAATLPATQVLAIPLRVVVPGADAISDASVAAGQLGAPDLASRLNDLATALTNLVQEPGSEVFKSQAVAAIDSVIAQLANDPLLAPLPAELAARGQALAAALTPAEVQAAVASLGQAMESLAALLADLAAHNFTLALVPNSALLLPMAATQFDLFLENTGSQPTTYQLSVAGLPASVTAAFSQDTVTLGPGEALVGGPSGVWLALTPGGDSLAATGFSVTAVAAQAPAVVRTAAGVLTVRDELVQVVDVVQDPPFTAPGGTVQISARVLNAVNVPREAEARFVVRDPLGQVMFTSPPVAVAFTLTTSLATVALGSFDTTGLAPGNYQVEVQLQDPATGTQLAGGQGQGALQVGLPVTASLDVTPQALPPGDSLVHNELVVEGLPAPGSAALRLVGQVQTAATSGSIALHGDLAYVASATGIDIVNISDPANPVKLSTFGAAQLGTVSYALVRRQGDELFVGASASRSANRFVLLTYSIAADPLSPQLVSSTQFNYEFLADLLVQGDTILAPTFGYAFSFGGAILGQFGTVLSVNTANAAAPALADVLFNSIAAPQGGPTPQFRGALATDRIAYVSSTTSSGAAFQTGQGRVLVVDYADSANLALLRQVIIPGTYITFDVAIDGNRALVLGNSGAAISPGGGYSGNMTLSVLDISDPANPQPLGNTLVTSGEFRLSGSTAHLQPLGNGLFAVTSTLPGGQRQLLLADTRDPGNITVSAINVPAAVNEMAAAGNLLYTTSSSGLMVYELGGTVDVTATASVPVPKGTGVELVAGSFNVPPTNVISGVDADTLVWEFVLDSATPRRTFTWQSQVRALQPGESRPVAGPGTVDFVSQGTPGQLTLPAASVLAEQVLSLDPASRTVRPGQPAEFLLTVENPGSLSATYDLALAGVPAEWVAVAPQVTVPALGSVTVPLVLTSDPAAPESEQAFVVTASRPGFSGSVVGRLVLSGEPFTADPDAHGVVVDLTPSAALAGPGTQAAYVARVTNTGSTREVFALSVLGLPAGYTVSLAASSVEIPPGASNFRDVPFLVRPPLDVVPSVLPLRVRAASSRAADEAAATLQVLGLGVDLEITEASSVPGGTLHAVVRNTGRVRETFDLALAGPAALEATLSTLAVTLAAGEARTVTIQLGPANLAVAGPLSILAVARARTNPAIQDADSAELLVPGRLAMSAEFESDLVELAGPGQASFVLQVNNLGNLEDAYTATIRTTSGPVAASLVGLDGQLTQTVPVFRLPGLSLGALALQAQLAELGTGTITVEIRSLTDGSLVDTATATLRAAPAAAGGYAVRAGQRSDRSDDEGRGIAVDAQGNAYVTGTFYFADGPSSDDTSTQKSDLFIAKYGPDGSLLWQHLLGGSGDDRGRAVALDASGHVYVTGAFQGSVDFDPSPAGSSLLRSSGGFDAFVLKLTSDGQFVWARQFGGSDARPDIGYGLAVDPQGRVLVTGQFAKKVDFDPSPAKAELTSQGQTDAFVLQLSDAGQFRWVQRLGGKGADRGTAVFADPQGHVYTTGSFSQKVDFDPGPASHLLTSGGGLDAFVWRLDPAGNFVSARRFGGSSTDEGLDLEVDGQGRVAVTGYFRNRVDFDPGPGTTWLEAVDGADVFLLQLNAQSSLNWARSYGSDDDDRGRGLTLLADGSVALTGDFEETFHLGSGVTLTSPGKHEVFLIQVDPSGALTAGMRLGGPLLDIGRAIDSDAAGNFYVTGFFTGSIAVDTNGAVVTLNSAGGRDLFVAKIAGPPGGPWQLPGGGGGIAPRAALAAPPPAPPAPAAALPPLFDARDVNRDGAVTPLDALRIIHHLDRPAAADAALALDVNGDGQVTPLDALLVIHQLDAPPPPPRVVDLALTDPLLSEAALAVALPALEPGLDPALRSRRLGAR